jgi:hypothetical protein
VGVAVRSVAERVEEEAEGAEPPRLIRPAPRIFSPS